MAGVLGPKWDPKKVQASKQWNSPEFNANSAANNLTNTTTKTEARPIFSLSGVLGLNQTVDIHKKETPAPAPEKKTLFVNHLEQESKMLFDTREKELQKEIAALRTEIQKLIAASGELSHDVEVAALLPTIEANTYQIKFLGRLRELIASFRRNVSEGSAWMQTLNKRKSRKNAFWGTVKNKKKGGEQYLFSNEHSAARSAN